MATRARSQLAFDFTTKPANDAAHGRAANDVARKWTIYCHIHRESGKRYVGQTRFTMERRWQGHLFHARHKYGSYFQFAIRKHGPDAFDHEVLEICHTQEASDAAERRWIAHFRSDDKAVGYNLSAGGPGRTQKDSHPTDEEFSAGKPKSDRPTEVACAECKRAVTVPSRGVVPKTCKQCARSIVSKRYNANHRDRNRARYEKWHARVKDTRNADRRARRAMTAESVPV